MRVIVLGLGAVGSRAARQLASSRDVDGLVLCDRAPGRAESVAESIGPVAAAEPWHPALMAGADALVIAAPLTVTRASFAVPVDVVEAAIQRRVHVVAVSDAMGVACALLGMDRAAADAGVNVVIGAGLAPGLSDVLARLAAASFDEVDEIHVAKVGTGGPACAREHHRALGDEAVDWRDGAWARRPGGSGRELLFFPDPVGGRDCYRAGLPDARLLVPAFPDAERVTARVAATRLDRMTAALPMLRRPHPEGHVGAVRVEVRGVRTGARSVTVLGAIDRPGVAAGAVAAVSAQWAVGGLFSRRGAAGLASLVADARPFLAELHARGVKAATFEGGHPS